MTVIHLFQFCFFGGLWAAALAALFHWVLGMHWGWGVAAGYAVYFLWVLALVIRGPDGGRSDAEQAPPAGENEPEMSGGVNLGHLVTFLVGGGLVSWGLAAWLGWHWWIAVPVGYAGFPLLFFVLGLILERLDSH